MQADEKQRAQHELPGDHRVAVFSLDSGADMAARVCEELGIEPGRHEEREFGDGEHKIRPLESVRGRDVYVVQSLHGESDLSVNDKLVRVLSFLGALRDAGAGRVTAVAPYLCYTRKDRRTKPRDPLTNRYVATLFESMGIDRMVTVDVHSKAAYENAFEIPTEHLTATPAFVDTFAPMVGDDDVAVVSPDAGGVKRAESFRQALQNRLDRPVASAFVEKYRSEGEVWGGALVGKVDGRVAIVLDDLVSSGGTLARAADACREHGAKTCWAAATHGVFSAEAGDTLRDSELERVVILDTIPPDRLDSRLLADRVDVVDSAPLIASAIHRLHTNGSIVELNEV